MNTMDECPAEDGSVWKHDAKGVRLFGEGADATLKQQKLDFF